MKQDIKIKRKLDWKLRNQISEIAKCSDKVLEMFKDTSIYNVLYERREFCRRIEEPATDDMRMIELYNRNLCEFFIISIKPNQ